MLRVKCDVCRDAAMNAAVANLCSMSRKENKEALILQYLITHKNENIDGHELLMLMAGIFGESWDLSSISAFMKYMRAKLVCKIGVELIEHEPESGYTVSSCCALFG